jgi:hypothetical protein
MLTAYTNNAEMRTGTHFRTCLNVFFDVRSLRFALLSDAEQQQQPINGSPVRMSLKSHVLKRY